ncbi:diheme cytochrome C [Leptothermofonsia sp. ETS-13]|uniref:diheme cytochrome C n=1 Tax=Leptothermofonsia sp. ETS-13 TaxID=3035696 RepID=UPI003B9F164B
MLLLLLLWSICLGWGLSLATEPRAVSPVAQGTAPSNPAEASPAIGTVDAVPDRLKLGQSIYLENCATCHVGLPPAVMPTETWRQLLQDPEHYGVNLKPLSGPYLLVVWEYIRYFSRPQSAEEEVPYRIYQSKYFKILHPRVKLPSKPGLSTCISCHPGADKYDFRTLSSEWQNAP